MPRSNFVRAFATPILAMVLLVAAGCGTSPSGGETSISVSAAALSEADVTRVTITIAGSGIDTPIVRELVKSAGRWQGTVAGIPSGAARTFTATAFDESEGSVYEGSATAPILSGQTTAVSILLQQTTASAPLSNDPPVVTALSMTPGVVAPNADATLAVTAADPDEGDVLSYAWTATGGSFTNDTDATATWTAPATEGTYTLTVTVSDAQGSTRSASIDAIVTNDPSRGSAAIDAYFNTWPEITGIGASPSLVAPGGSSTLTIAAFDADGDTLTVGYTDDCGGAFVGSSWTAPSVAPTSGICRITATVTDGRAGSSTATTTIAVGDDGVVVNHAPIVDTTSQSATEASSGTLVSFEITAYDLESQPLTFEWTTTAGVLDVPVDSAGASAIQLDASGTTTTVTVRVTDSLGAYAEHAFVVGAADAYCEGISCVHGSCVDAGGGVGACECASGWTGASCDEDVDECALGTAGCSPNATCTNLPGGATCACNPGYLGDGVTCTASCGAYTDVVYAIGGSYDIRGTTFGIGNQTFNGLGANATTPSWGTGGGVGSASPFNRPPAIGGVTFTQGFARLRFTNDAGGVPQMAGPVSLVQLYFPAEMTQTAGATAYHNLDFSYGVLDSTLTNCGAGGTACASHVPALARPCTAGPSGTITGTALTWGACTAWSGANAWNYTNARAATGAGCATGFNLFGNSNSSSGLVPASQKGDVYQTWNQRLSNLAFSSTNPAAASFTMDWIQIPTASGQSNHWIRISSATVLTTECGSTPGVDLTCDEQP